MLRNVSQTDHNAVQGGASPLRVDLVRPPTEATEERKWLSHFLPPSLRGP